MPAISSITISDNESPPVARTFSPARSDDQFAQWENRASEIYIGYDKITMRLIRPTGPTDGKTARNVKFHLKLETPLMKEESTGGTASGYTPAPEVDYRLVAELKVTLPVQSTKQERQNLRYLFGSLVSNSQTVAAWEDYDLAY